MRKSVQLINIWFMVAVVRLENDKLKYIIKFKFTKRVFRELVLKNVFNIIFGRIKRYFICLKIPTLALQMFQARRCLTIIEMILVLLFCGIRLSFFHFSNRILSIKIYTYLYFTEASVALLQ